jgi:hypothetical protein
MLTLRAIRRYCEDGIEKSLKQMEGELMVSGAYNRKKGHDFERECAKQFREVMPDTTIKRGIQTRGGAEDKVPDIIMPVFAPECKRTKQPNIRKAYEQAVEACPKGKIPCAITRANGQAPLFTLSMADMLDFIGEWYGSREV